MVCILSVLIGIAVGSVYVPIGQIISAFAQNITGIDFNVPDNIVQIIVKVRFPRVMLAFLTGAALSLSGAVVQAVLGNPLASPFTLGSSSGASLGACTAIVLGLNILGGFTLSVFGIAFSVASMFLMLAFAKKADKSLKSGTVVLTGMVLSLFISAAVSLMSAISEDKYRIIVKWQSGSFAGRGMVYSAALAAVLAYGLIYAMLNRNELDIMTFGDEQAQSLGIDTEHKKTALLVMSAVISGTAVSFAGVIGFVDLISPHIARKIFGARHKLLIPMSAVIGGIFTVLCDTAARTVTAPRELPVGVVTSLLGAPFFAYVFLLRKKKK